MSMTALSSHDLVVTPRGLRFAGRRFACTIGRGGCVDPAHKREGDGATPRGRHRLVGLLYRPDRLPRPARWAEPVLPGDLWCDAPDHAAYNSWVRAPFDASHERLRRADPLYDLVLVSDWNWPVAQPGRGSAIFVHRWRRPGAPTEGCVALHPADLRWIAARIGPGAGLVVL